MNGNRNEEKSVHEFWQEFEAETGEKVAAKTIAQYFPGPGNKGQWGIAILTDRSFRFRIMPAENWLMSLVRSNSSSSLQEKEKTIIFPLDDIARVDLAPKKFSDRVFGTPFETFTLQLKSAPDASPARFSADPARQFYKALHSAVESAVKKEEYHG